MFANQRDELVCSDQECDRIDEPEQSQNDKSSKPIGISQCEKFLENAVAVSHSEILLTSRRTPLQRSTVWNKSKASGVVARVDTHGDEIELSCLHARVAQW